MSETLHLEAPIYTEPDTAEIIENGSADIDFDSYGIEVALTEVDTGNQVSENDESKAENDVSDKEISNDNWDAQLTSYVSGNANELVVMGGVEMTLSEAMFMFPPITKENVDTIYAQVKRMVAEAAAKKNEEPDESEGELEQTEEAETLKAEDKPAKAKEDDKKINAKDKKPEAQENPIKADAEIPAPKQTTREEHSFRPAGRAGMVSVLQSSKLSVKAETHVSPAAVSNGPSSAAGTGVSEAPAVISIRAEGSPPEPAISENSRDYAFTVDEAAASPDTESGPAIDGPLTIAGQDYESLIPSEAFEPAGEAIEPLSIDVDATEPSELQAVMSELKLAAIDRPAEIGTPANFIEAELPIACFEGIVLEPDETYTPAQEPVLKIKEYHLETAEEASTASQERFIPDVSAIEETECVLTELSDQLKAAPPAVIDEVNDILVKIIEVPVRLKSDDGEIITETDARQELEELFSELLADLDIGYTPELIESLARLTLNWHLAEQIEKLKEEEPDKLPRDPGTHEIIRKLLAALGVIKKAVAQAATIGRSALRLYSFNLAVLNT